jgi:2-polyprenyl-6-methoxyphenol hydroxylase-like FAD-dependent oxidoreductase
MTKVRTALVIGGGIAGPVAGMALRKAGIEARVYEAYPGTADGIGGMLGIAPNGLAALDVIDAADVVLNIGEPVRSMVIESWTGKRLAEFGGQGDDPVFHAVWRGELYRAMYDKAVDRGVPVSHGKRLTTVRSGEHDVTAYFADGTSATADILVAADGIRSTVRSIVDSSAPQPRYTGLLGFGGSVDTELPPTGGSMHMSFGKRAFFAYSVAPDGSTGWFANLPWRERLSLAGTREIGATRWLRTLRQAFAADRTPAPEILDQVHPADLIMVGALEDLPTVPTWHRDRTVLIGDAAHATSPSSGQGASMAVESAVQLARCLRDVPTVAGAFQAYEGLRRARVERIIADGKRKSSEKAAGPAARRLRDAIMPVTMKLLAKPEKMAWQYDYRIDWPAPVANTPTEPVRRPTTVS